MAVAGKVLAGHACSLSWSPGRGAWWRCSLRRHASRCGSARAVAGLAGDALLRGDIIDLAWMVRVVGGHGGSIWFCQIWTPTLGAAWGSTLAALGRDSAWCVWYLGAVRVERGWPGIRPISGRVLGGGRWHPHALAGGCAALGLGATGEIGLQADAVVAV